MEKYSIKIIIDKQVIPIGLLPVSTGTPVVVRYCCVCLTTLIMV